MQINGVNGFSVRSYNNNEESKSESVKREPQSPAFRANLSLRGFRKCFTPEQVRIMQEEIYPRVAGIGSPNTNIRLSLLTDQAPDVLVRRTVTNSDYPGKCMEDIFSVPYNGERGSLFGIIERAINELKPAQKEEKIGFWSRLFNKKHEQPLSNLDKKFLEHLKMVYGPASDSAQMRYFRGPYGKFSRTKAHYASPDSLFEMHKALKEQPELLNLIHLASDARGYLPIHTVSRAGREEICRAYGSHIEDLANIYLFNPKNFKLEANNIEGGTIEQKVQNVADEVLQILQCGRLSNDMAYDLSEAYKTWSSDIDLVNQDFKVAKDGVA